MMTFLELVQKEVKNSLKLENISTDIIEISVPKNTDHGDFSINIAFKLAKQLKKSPMLIADDLVLQLNSSKIFTVTNLNGYLNLKIKDEYLFDYYNSFLNSTPKLKENKKILLEYVSANPTGPLHIGHGRWAAIGDSLYRLLKKVNTEVNNEFYINDAGNQINKFNQSVDALKNNLPVPEDGYGGYFIKQVIEEKDNNETNIDYVLNYQKNTLKMLNCEFDTWFKESSLHENNILEIIKNNFSNYIYQKDNAIWFKTTEFNDDKDRVIKKETGELTYFAADIVYHLNKINRGFNKIINIWGADHHGYVERVKSIIDATNKAIDFKVILGQLVHLYKNGEPVKMSKRTGELIELQEVINEIGSDATRYFLVEKKPELHLDFDLLKAQEKSMNNPVYYIQYAHARICAIFDKIDKEDLAENSNLELNEKDRKLMISGSRYHDVLIESANNLEVHKITNYLYSFCQDFHSFYKENKVIYNNHLHVKRKAILLTTKKIIQDALLILGVSCPEKM